MNIGNSDWSSCSICSGLNPPLKVIGRSSKKEGLTRDINQGNISASSK